MQGFIPMNQFYTAIEASLQGFSHLHEPVADNKRNLVISMKILWKILDLLLLFVRYPFIMKATSIMEEYACG